MSASILTEEPLLRYLVYLAFLVLLIAAVCIIGLTVYYILYEDPEPMHIYHWMPAEPLVKTSDIVDLRVNAKVTSSSVDEDMLYKVPKVNAIPVQMFPGLSSRSDPMLPEGNRKHYQAQAAI